MNRPLILVINPGSTSTKLAVFQGDSVLFEKNLAHSTEELSRFPNISSQLQFRKQAVVEFLLEIGIPSCALGCIMGRGGFLKPISSGTYLVNDRMCRDLLRPAREHASNLGALIAKEIADEAGIKAFIVDPVIVDELDAVARISGMAGVERKSFFHALNQKACARKAALFLNRSYEECNLIVAHLGGGITVGAHQRGRVIDVNNGLDGEGPFSPERAGGVPVGALIEACFRDGADQKEIYKRVVGKGGLVSYLGTNDARTVERRIREGDEEARLIYEAMAYQIAKEIGSCATVMKGNVDAVAITGGLAHSELLAEWIRRRVEFLAPVLVYPGEDEMEALAAAGLRLLSGTEQYKVYDV